MSDHDNFIDIAWTSRNLHLSIVRTSILNALKENLVNFEGKLLDAGCGKMPYRAFILAESKVDEYTGLDIENAKNYDPKIRPDFVWDGITMPFENATYDTVIATEVLEHCPEPEVFLKEVFRVLKPTGRFFFTVPFLWNLHEVPFDEYRYTPFSLHRHLSNSGFKDIQIKAMGGWHASMAQMLGLWVRRAPMSRYGRALLSKLLKPIIKFLYNRDNQHEVEFVNGQMINGLYGIVTK